MKWFLLVLFVFLIGGSAVFLIKRQPVEEESIEENENVPEIYRHALFLATSEDGKSFDYDSDNPVIEHASVPDLIMLEKDIGNFQKGDLLSYFVDTTLLKEGNWLEEIGLVVSTDNGKSWSEKVLISIAGAEEHVPVDPSIVQLSDGRLRLYYYDFRTGLERGGAKMYVAESTDALSFDFVQEALTYEAGGTDPDVIFFDGQWLMYFSCLGASGAICIATSEDGLSFTFVESTEVSGVPGTLIENDQIGLYGCQGQGITKTLSKDGMEFSLNSTRLILSASSICDPAPVQLEDSTYAMIIKWFPSSNLNMSGRIQRIRSLLMIWPFIGTEWI